MRLLHLDVARRERSDGGEERTERTLHAQMPEMWCDLEDLAARGPRHRLRRAAVVEDHAHAARRHPPDIVDGRYQAQRAAAEQTDPIADALDFRQHVRR